MNDGLTPIPRTAKVLKDDSDDIVAYKLVKAPVVKEFKRYYSDRGACYNNRHVSTTAVVVFTEIDGVLTDVRLEKL